MTRLIYLVFFLQSNFSFFKINIFLKNCIVLQIKAVLRNINERLLLDMEVDISWDDSEPEKIARFTVVCTNIQVSGG
jgi:hypothetical protein